MSHRLLGLLCLLAQTPVPPAEDAPLERPTLRVRQEGTADFVGNDDVALAAALDRLRPTGGTLVVGPGRWLVRRVLFLPTDIVVRGEPGAVLALPAPALTGAAAPAGTRALTLAGPHEFAPDTRVQILPPVGSAYFPDGKTESLELQTLARVEGQALELAEALAVELPAGSRVGYPHKLLWVNKLGLATIEDLAFEGGLVDAIPMPGHSWRCAIWASAPYGFGPQRLGPPGRGVVVRNCRFTGWYGRGVAFYNFEDGVVEGCRFERIRDEAIDLDHFVEGFRVARNEIEDVLWGIVLNDASRNVIEANRIQTCDIGIWSWRYELTPPAGINEENVIRGNIVRGARQHPILIDKTCVRYVIQENEVEGSIVVVEQDNTVGPNTQLEPER